MTDIKLLGISGSLRAGSLNTKLMHEGARLMKPGTFDVAELRMPLYDGDIEAADGPPKEAQRLHDLMAQADAILIATPEYNGKIPGGLKNALDWVSRIKPGPIEGKPTAIVSASAGRAGGVLAQRDLREALTAFRPLLVLGPPVMVASANDAFDEGGKLTSEQYSTALSTLMEALAQLVQATKAA